MRKILLIALLLIAAGMIAAAYKFMQHGKSPVQVVDFESFTLIWGKTDSLLNRYDSKTGNYQYVDRRDSLHRTQVRLHSNEIIFLHHKINELGFWGLPATIGSPAIEGKTQYALTFHYKGRSKTMKVYQAAAPSINLQLDSAMRLIGMVQAVIDEADNRYHSSSADPNNSPDH